MIVLVTGRQGTGKSTIAEHCADTLGAPVFAWDWCMAALTPFDALQTTIETLDLPTYRKLGWEMMFQAARAQARRGMSVVLDGMARDLEVGQTRDLATQLGTPSLVVHTVCADLDVQRARIEGRDRAIPGWHELTWEQVDAGRARWVPPSDVDLTLDTTRTMAETVDEVTRILRG